MQAKKSIFFYFFTNPESLIQTLIESDLTINFRHIIDRKRLEKLHLIRIKFTIF